MEGKAIVQIRSRKTGFYDKKGFKGWTDKPHLRGAWGALGQAKNHINLFEGEALEPYLYADFIILDDEHGQVRTEPIGDWLMERFEKYIKKNGMNNYYQPLVECYKDYIWRYKNGEFTIIKGAAM